MDLLRRYIEFETRDLDETEALVRADVRQCRMEVTRPRAPYYVRMRSAQADLLTITETVNAAPLMIWTEPDPRAYLLTLRYGGRSESRWGRRSRSDGPGEFLLRSPGRLDVYRTSGDDSVMVVRIPAELLEREARYWAGRDVDVPFEIAQPFKATGSGVGLALHGLLEAVNLDPPLPLAAQWCARNLILKLVTGTNNSWRPFLECTPDKPLWGPRHKTVWRAEAYMEAHLTQPFSIGDVAHAAEVGTRALEYSFQRVRGRKPVAMRLTLRLDEARRRFERGEETTGVTAVSRALGFSNVGRFVADYERQFHETPAATLARAHRQKSQFVRIVT